MYASHCGGPRDVATAGCTRVRLTVSVAAAMLFVDRHDTDDRLCVCVSVIFEFQQMDAPVHEHVEAGSLFPILGAGALSLDDVREAVANTAEFKTSTCDDEDDKLMYGLTHQLLCVSFTNNTRTRTHALTHNANFRFYNYRWCTRATFPDLSTADTERQRQLYLLRRECRGLVFRVDASGAVSVAARRFHKFFNINVRILFL